MSWKNGIDLQQLLTRLETGANTGLHMAAENTLRESNEHVPIEEATLERSGKVSLDPGNFKAAVSYNTPYAVVQHEDMSFEHDEGRTAKYLENAFNSQADTNGRIIAGAIRAELGT